MTLKIESCLIPLALAATLAACTAADPPSKDEIRSTAGKADHIDWCAEFDWYGDGECDTFCTNFDYLDCTDTTFTVKGENFANYPFFGGDVYVTFDQGGDPATIKHTTIAADGTFELTWTNEWTPYSYGAFVQVWYDNNGDGACWGWGDDVRSYWVNPTSQVVVDGSTWWQQPQMWCDQFAKSDWQPIEDPVDCAATCALRTGGCFPESMCLQLCENRIRYASQVVTDAFDVCVNTDPLCYLLGEQCVSSTVPCLLNCQDAGNDRAACKADCDHGF